jgi:hypothetical protein
MRKNEDIITIDDAAMLTVPVRYGGDENVVWRKVEKVAEKRREAITTLECRSLRSPTESAKRMLYLRRSKFIGG